MSEDCTCAACGKQMDYDDAFTHVDHGDELSSYCCRACYEKSEKSGK